MGYNFNYYRRSKLINAPEEVTIKNIQKWASDESFYFGSQDEELCLHGSKFIPILVELAAKLVIEPKK